MDKVGLAPAFTFSWNNDEVSNRLFAMPHSGEFLSGFVGGFKAYCLVLNCFLLLFRYHVGNDVLHNFSPLLRKMSRNSVRDLFSSDWVCFRSSFPNDGHLRVGYRFGTLLADRSHYCVRDLFGVSFSNRTNDCIIVAPSSN